MDKIRYADKLQKGSITLEKKDNTFILSNLDTGINTRFNPREYTRAIENFQMWVKMSKKRFADW